jgi:hypothetical protein
MDMWQLYWIMKLDSIRIFLNGLGTGAMTIGAIGSVVCVFALVAMVVCKSEGKDEDANIAFKVLKFMYPFPFGVVPLAIMLFLAHALIPSTKEMAAIIVIPQVVNAVSESETIQKLPGKILNLADEWINELSPKKSDVSKESN